MENNIRISVVLVIICFALLSPCVLVGAEGINLVENGDFELVDAEGKLVGFDYWLAEGDVAISVVDTAARSGQRSVQISGSSTPRGCITYRTDIQGGSKYRIQVWYLYDIDGPWESPKGNVPWMGHHVMMRLMAYGEDGKKIKWDENWLADPDEGWFDVRDNIHVLPAPWELGNTEEWSSLVVTVNFPENVKRIEVNLFNWYGEGAVYFDDFSLIQL